jgi:maltose alpha-D-glucosyltransferase/alpha-amylase
MLTGSEVRETIRSELKSTLTGKNAPYNLPFSQNGIACTTTTVVAASLGYNNLSNLSHDQIENIKNGHLLLAMFNALQPGVFALSGWDLAGSLTLDKKEVDSLLADGDTRWINRGAYNLLGDMDESAKSNMGIPMARSVYGPLPEQLKNHQSFASKLKHVLKIRDFLGLAQATQLEVPSPPIANKSVLIMIHKLPNESIQATVLNFANQPITTTVQSYHFELGQTVRDALNGDIFPSVDRNKETTVSIPAFGGLCLIIQNEKT